MKQCLQTTRIKTSARFFQLVLVLTIALVFGHVAAHAQVDGNDDTAPMADPSDPVEEIGTDSEQPYDTPVEEYQDIVEDHGEEIIEEEPIYDEEPYPEEGESEPIPLEDVDPDQLENPVEEDDFEFKSEFEDYDPDAVENPSEEEWDDPVGSEFEEIDPGEPEDPMEDDGPGAELE